MLIAGAGFITHMRRSYENNLSLLSRKRLFDRKDLREISRTKTTFSSPQLTTAQIQSIRQRIKLQEQEGLRRSIVVLFLSLVLGVPLFLAVLKAIVWLYF